MQALQIHLNPQPAAMSGQGANVHGMNAPIRDDYSFDSFLQKEMSEQTSKAKEGPPENRNSVSDPPKADTATNSEAESEKIQTEKEPQTEKELQTEKEPQTEKELQTEEEPQTEKVTQAKKEPQSEDSRGSEKVGENSLVFDVFKKEGEEEKTKLTTENSSELLQLQTDIAASTALSDGVLHGENLPDAKNALLIGEKPVDDKQSEDSATKSDDVLLAVLGAGILSGTEQIANKKPLAMNGAGDETGKVETIKKSKQVLAEIPTINVQDERTVSAEGKADGNFVNSVNHDGNGNATMDLSITPNNANLQNTAGTIVNADGSVQQHTATNAQQFGTMLSAEIQSNSSELVKTGSIVLRDGNQGTINLILHPEELGNVKISLEISDNILSGRITVASEEAYNAFKANLASLRDAFIAEGFDTAGFDLSWSGQENGQPEQEQESQGKNPFGNRYDDNIAIISDDTETEGDYNSYGSRAYINVMV